MIKKIIITGGAGFIGSHLVDRLLLDNWDIGIIDNFNNFYPSAIKHLNIKSFKNSPMVTIYKGDITQSTFVKKIITSFKPTHIVHLAAIPGVRASFKNPAQYMHVNVNGTIQLLEAIKNTPITNFIFASSSSIYGNNSKLPFSENDEILQSLSPYALSKRTAEHICNIYSDNYKIPISCLRFFTVYGPRQRPDQAINKFISNITDNKPIEIFGEMNSSRDYTYIDDIIDGIYKSIYKPYLFEIINLGNSSPVTLEKLISLLEKCMSKKIEIIHKPAMSGESKHTYADIRKAKKLLQWVPKTSITEGLIKTLKMSL